jgi:ADP-heptose:LPS heptosyltransferase
MRDLFRVLLRKGNFDLVIDMHDHIRTMMLRSMFKLFGTPVIVFDKGRKDKKAFTRRENKVTDLLPHTVERYHAAFEKAGFNFPIESAPYLVPDQEAKAFVEEWLGQKKLNKKEQWIGIAPFAMHTSKVWPTEYYPALIEKLIAAKPVKIFFFGGGANEIKFFEGLVEKFPDHCIIVAGQMKIRHEIALLQHLDLMVCVDSSNMHLAALSGIPLLAIWGGTHPDIGFSPYGSKSNILQISREELPCRPCSVYGKETCFRADFACLNRITPDKVLAEILKQ